MGKLIFTFFIFCIAQLGISETVREVSKEFASGDVRFIYSYDQRKILFKDLNRKVLGMYDPEHKLSLLENDIYKQYNVSLLALNKTQILITQWENGSFVTVRVFAPFVKSLEQQGLLLCEVSLRQDAFDWGKDLAKVKISGSGGLPQITFVDHENREHLCKRPLSSR